MSLKDVKKELLAETQKEIKNIKKQTEEEKNKILSDAKNTKKEILNSAKKTVELIIDSETKEEISAANLESKRILNEAKELAVQNALEELWQEFLKIRKLKNYSKILKKLVEEGQKEIPGKKIILVNKKDKKLLKGFSNVKDSSIAAGAIITSSDGKIIVNNSFEALFEFQKDSLKKTLFKELF